MQTCSTTWWSINTNLEERIRLTAEMFKQNATVPGGFLVHNMYQMALDK